MKKLPKFENPTAWENAEKLRVHLNKLIESIYPEAKEEVSDPRKKIKELQQKLAQVDFVKDGDKAAKIQAEIAELVEYISPRADKVEDKKGAPEQNDKSDEPVEEPVSHDSDQSIE